MIEQLDADDPGAERESAARVVDLLGGQTDTCSALGARTARDLLLALHDEPSTKSDLADRVDTSLQNVQYHVGKLEGADLVTAIDTRYSEKGREMDVFAATADPLVLVLGSDGRADACREAATAGTGNAGSRSEQGTAD